MRPLKIYDYFTFRQDNCDYQLGDSTIVYSALQQLEGSVVSQAYGIKIPLNGQENYYLKGRTFHVNAGNILLVNPQTTVDYYLDAKEIVEGLCIDLSVKTVGQVWEQAQHSIADSLNLTTRKRALPELLEHNTRTAYTQLAPLIRKLIRNRENAFADADDFFYQLAESLLGSHQQIEQYLQKIEVTQRNTREELYRRLDVLRTYILDSYTSPPTLDKLAQTACLSKYHALRLYKKVYGITPYQHIQQLRIQSAANLLQHQSITATAQSLGFSDRRAFSKAFRQWYGMSPLAYQQKM